MKLVKHFMLKLVTASNGLRVICLQLRLFQFWHLDVIQLCCVYIIEL
ncbi:hypothetical protein LSH36_1041g00028 [Paralvinella palmiformis]|uniref:Uncharacterized protein n=1 Tax=Paralvinella palmiformis TaxID=53620 RepID=A0AAD9IXB2_9ANNE|nr:hypothetical protein LSH36_1041g00028 [Paralvinella palmiformis]